MISHFLLAQVSPTSGDASPAGLQSVFDMITRGGVMMIPIGICSLVALTVVVERTISLRRRQIIPPSFLPGLRSLLGEGLSRRKDAIEYCRRSNSPIGRIFETGIKRLGEPVDLLERHVQEAGEREVYKLRKNLRALALIAAISPLMGLLGTIFGMIQAFQTVAASGEALGKTELLAEGIYQALITTAAGLVVAIPALVGFHWLTARMEGLVSAIDQMTMSFIEDYVLPLASASDRSQATRPRPVSSERLTGGNGRESPAPAEPHVAGHEAKSTVELPS